MSFESKFVAPASVAPRLVARLTQALSVDPSFPDDRVHSVYFDTWDERAVAEVRNGDYYKTKLRVRWYASSGPSRAWLERKRKLGGRRAKSRTLLAGFDPTLPLHSAAWRRAWDAWSQESDAPLPQRMEPTLHLAYRRRRFVHRPSGTRVAVDDDIRLVGVHPRLSAATPPRDVPHREMVLEVKGDARALPAPLCFVRQLGLRRRSFSKYGVCRGVA